MLKDIIRYIIQFLTGPDADPMVSDLVGYTSDERDFANYRVVIIPSGFFLENTYGTPHSLPVLPLGQIDNIPVLFGIPVVEQRNGVVIVHADIIAGSYFLLSRYEEMVCRDVRDEHGRFPGKKSLPFRAGFMHRPVVDEYGVLLRKWLYMAGITVANPPQVFRQINLTHDVDSPFMMRTWRNIARGLKERKPIGTLLRTKFGPLEKDPYYTFPWLLNENQRIRSYFGDKRFESIFFFKAGGKALRDKPHYNLYGKDINTLLKLVSSHNAVIGLHGSYQAGIYPHLIHKEKRHLEKVVDHRITINRHHFLASREPEDMLFLEQAGISDDYTMGYADVAGFRLGTSRPVRRIDAVNRRLSSLLLHPLQLMDSSLIEQKYMGLNRREATLYCRQVITQTRIHHGELTMLWHNTSVADGSGYLKQLYRDLLDFLCNENSTDELIV